LKNPIQICMNGSVYEYKKKINNLQHAHMDLKNDPSYFLDLYLDI
jgi:hypothetical protein